MTITTVHPETTTTGEVLEILLAEPRTRGKAPRDLPAASVWVKASKTTWDMKYNGYSFSASKVEGVWHLFEWNLIAEDWDEVTLPPVSVLRDFWKLTCRWLDANRADALNVQEVTEPASQTGLTREQVAEGVRSVELEIIDSTPDVEPEDTSCPKCGKDGDEKCVTKSGKAVKENGGFHAARPGK